MRPIIGMLVEIDNDQTAKALVTYASAVECAGGLPVVLPYVCDTETIAEFVRLCDGFLFTGGMDIEPARYNEDKKPTCGENQLFRDELEFKVFDEVMRSDKPILAICRGAQLVNVALGGTLRQDIVSEIQTDISHRQTEGKYEPSHDVLINESTPLYELIGESRMTANSFHHQAIKGLGQGLKVMAEAPDGVIEGVYMTGSRYIRAYQWHPERLFRSSEQNKRIFADFILACRKKEKC